MSVPPIIFAYSLSVIVGVILIIYGLLPAKTGRKGATEPDGPGFSGDVSSPSDEVLPLRFADEDFSMENRGTPGEDRAKSCPPGRSQDRRPWRISQSAGKVFKMPFGTRRRRKASPDGMNLDEPITTEILIGPRSDQGTDETGKGR